MDEGSRAAEEKAYFIFCPSQTLHHVPFPKSLWYVPYAYAVYMILN
jgi:hypothetical protein